MKEKLTNAQRAEVIVQALPYIQRYSEKIIVVKYGGKAILDDGIKRSVMGDLVLLSTIGIKVVLVHDGGGEITEVMDKMGMESKFIDGQRVTGKDAAEVAQMVLAGKISKNLVGLICNSGGKAMGLSGMDGGMIKAKPKSDELGFVGDISEINPQPILDVLDMGYIPVISSLGYDSEGNSYSIDGDTAAAWIAGTLKAESLISMTDVAGILKDEGDIESLISEIRVSEAPQLMRDGIITGGMVTKVDCCIDAIRRGVKKVFILDGGVPHAILIETLTDEGIGTMLL